MKFKSYVDDLKILSLPGPDEPLLDRTLDQKIKFAKELGSR